VFDVLIREALAARTLCEAHPAAERVVVGGDVDRVETVYGEGTFDADKQWRTWGRGHCCWGEGGEVGLSCGLRFRLGSEWLAYQYIGRFWYIALRDEEYN